MINALSKISECLSPVVFVLFLFLLSWWFFSGIWKKYQQATVCWCIIFLIMFVWRIGIQIHSSRYASGLIFPVLAVTLLITLQIGRKLSFHGSSVGKRGVIFLTVVLSIFFIAKLSRISPYADYLIRASQALNQVVIPYRAPIILSEQENNRLHYYSKLPINHFTFSTGSKNLVDTLRKEVEYYSGCADAVIFCVRVEKEQLLEFQKTDAKIVFQSYTNRQREKVFAIILFSNLPALNIEQICRNSSEIDTPNVIWTESFSTGVKNNPNTPHNRLLTGRRLFFFQNPDIILPKNWSPYSYYRKTYTAESKAEYELIVPEPFSDRVLRMKSDSCIMLGCLANFEVNSGCIKAVIKGKPGSRFGFLISELSPDWHYKGVWGEKKFWLPDENSYIVTWKLADLPPRFRIGLVLLHGEIFIKKIDFVGSNTN